MKKPAPIHYSLLAILYSLFLPAQTAQPYAWDAGAHPPQTARIQVWRGDTVPLAPRWAMPTNGWAFTAYWQTNGMGDAWWSKSDAPLLWTPDMDCGARAYRLFIRADSAGGASYRANAEISMLESPGAQPNALPLPVQTIDFALVAVTNAPWLTAADIPPPTAPPVTSVNGQTGAVTVTAQSIGAVTHVNGKTGPSISLRASDVHAVEYEQDPAAAFWLAEYARTNSVNRWRDAADPARWWEVRGGTSLVTWADSRLIINAETVYWYSSKPPAESEVPFVSTRNLGPGGEGTWWEGYVEAGIVYLWCHRIDTAGAAYMRQGGFSAPVPTGDEVVNMTVIPEGVGGAATVRWAPRMGTPETVYDLTRLNAPPPDPIAPPVVSVNGQTGIVVLTAADIGAATLDDIANATNNLPTNYTTFGLVANFQNAAGMGMAFSQQFSGWQINPENITPSAVTNISQAYLPTIVRPGSQVRVLVHNSSASALFRGRLVIPYNVSTVYAPNPVWRVLDIDQTASGITTWQKPLFDSGWMPLQGPDFGVHNDQIHDVAPHLRVRWDLSGIDTSGVVSNGTLAVRFIVRIPDVQSNDDKFGW